MAVIRRKETFRRRDCRTSRGVKEKKKEFKDGDKKSGTRKWGKNHGRKN